MELCWPFSISSQHEFSYFYIYWSACCSILSYDLIRRVVREEMSMSKIDFQDGRCGHLRFLIGTILAIFDLEIILLYSVSFNSKRQTVWEEKSKTGFQEGDYSGHFGFPISMLLANFHLHVNLLLQRKF